MPSELLNSGATARATSLAKRSRSVEDDGRADAEKITKKSAAEEHIEDNATFIVAEPVRSTGFDGDKFGESRGAVHRELLTQLVAADDVLGGGERRQRRGRRNQPGTKNEVRF